MLINCPKCGKPISDKAKSCPHCNETFEDVILKENSPMRDYMLFPDSEKKQLLNDFKNEEPKQAEGIIEQEKKLKLIKRVPFIGLGILIVLMPILIVLFVSEKISEVVFLVFIIGGVVICWVSPFFALISMNGNWCKQLVSYRYYEEWLRKKNIQNLKMSFKNKEMENYYKNLKINEKGEVYNDCELS